MNEELKNGCAVYAIENTLLFGCSTYDCKHFSDVERANGKHVCDFEHVHRGQCNSKPARREAAETAVALGRAYLEREETKIDAAEYEKTHPLL